eukprot:gb/GEZN01007764.1/.p1 GENE.gb/GEZN01007764.1/~~gb/GEZN01007764.1/.p1  ORF type:complete len:424 (+),score=58.94 gb/GEZN01007764.1/:37-1308(+)
MLLLTLVLSERVATAATHQSGQEGSRANDNLYSILRLEAELDLLLPTDAVVETVTPVPAGPGMSWVEGPVWLSCSRASSSSLLFSEIPSNRVFRLFPNGTLRVFLTHSGTDDEEVAEKLVEPGSNGLAIDKTGSLLLCQHGARQLARLVRTEQIGNTESEWLFRTVAKDYQDMRLNSPNDLVVNQQGTIYFTDPPYGLQDHKQGEAFCDHCLDAKRDINFSGLYVFPAGDLKPSLLGVPCSRPNGIGLSPDQRFLYVTCSTGADSHTMRRFPLTEDGRRLAGAGQVFINFTTLLPDVDHGVGTSFADGLAVSLEGYVFSSGPSGLYIFSPSGKHLGTVTVQAKDVRISNVAFGADGCLYLTATNRILCLKTLLSTIIFPAASPELCENFDPISPHFAEGEDAHGVLTRAGPAGRTEQIHGVEL